MVSASAIQSSVCNGAVERSGAGSERMPEGRVVRVAGIPLRISSDWPLASIRQAPAYAAFVCTAEPQVTIQARYDGLPYMSLRDEDLVFDSEAAWSLYHVDGQHVFVLRLPAPTRIPYRIAVFDAVFRQGVVYSQSLDRGQSPDGLLPDPLEFPLSEILMISLLAQGRGVMVHACGVDDGGRGYLFAGNSGHGKTTVARLWQGRATILNDDRIILRRREGRFWMYGTPWHGDYGGVSSQGVPLEKVFFLNHDIENHAQRKEGVAAASMLLARCFPPMWDGPGMGYTLDLLGELAQAVPCYDLGFVPDGRVVDLIRCMR